jgi:hypothetical protein
MSRNPRFQFLGLFLAFHLLVLAPSHAARTVLPLEDRQSRSSLFDWSPLVQQIQQFLIEFDLLAGPANGRMTPETQQAIVPIKNKAIDRSRAVPTKTYCVIWKPSAVPRH